MPEYTYRRTDGTTFTIRQKFSDEPLKTDPQTGQNVVRLVQPTGIIFKGSGFYVNDSKNASKSSLHTNGSSSSSKDSSESKPSDTTSKAESKTESKTTEPKADTKTPAAAD